MCLLAPYRKYCIDAHQLVWHHAKVVMPPPSLEVRIRALCALAIAAKDDEELSPILLQLQSALAEQIYRLRLMAAEEIPRVFGNESKAAD